MYLRVGDILPRHTRYITTAECFVAPNLRQSWILDAIRWIPNSNLKQDSGFIELISRGSGFHEREFARWIPVSRLPYFRQSLLYIWFLVLELTQQKAFLSFWTSWPLETSNWSIFSYNFGVKIQRFRTVIKAPKMPLFSSFFASFHTRVTKAIDPNIFTTLTHKHAHSRITGPVSAVSLFHE